MNIQRIAFGIAALCVSLLAQNMTYNVSVYNTATTSSYMQYGTSTTSDNRSEGTASTRIA